MALICLFLLSPAHGAPAQSAESAQPADSAQPAAEVTQPADSVQPAGPATGAGSASYTPPEGDDWVEFCGSASAEDIKKALAAGADVNFVSTLGLTPLLSASGFNRNIDAVAALLEAGADIDAVESRYGLNALMLAASHNPLPEMIDFLISKGISKDYQNFQGGTALIQAVSSNPNPLVAEALIKAGAAVNGTDSMGATPLMHAAGYGKTPVIRKLLEHKADINAVDNNGDTALAWAARSNIDSGAIFELLKAKADPTARNNKGLSPLYQAAFNQNSDVLAILLQATNNDFSLLNSPEDGSALFASVYSNPNVNVTRRLLSLGGDVNQPHPNGLTILMASLFNPEPAMTKLILTQGTDPNKTDPYGHTALMLAAAVADDPVVIRLLLGAGADPSLKDNEGLTATEYASRNKNQTVAEMFDRFPLSDTDDSTTPPAGDMPDQSSQPQKSVAQ